MNMMVRGKTRKSNGEEERYKEILPESSREERETERRGGSVSVKARNSQ